MKYPEAGKQFSEYTPIKIVAAENRCVGLYGLFNQGSLLAGRTVEASCERLLFRLKRVNQPIGY